jgi:uncharacterized protein YndB with AHSA1/START domain
MPSIEFDRIIGADPTSGVLLLAAPAAAELWPGTSLLSSEPGDHSRVSVDGIDEPVLVRAMPPQRTPTAFHIRFTFSVPGSPPCDGELTLTHARLDDGEPGATLARLVLRVPDNAELLRRTLTEGAPTFLDNLAAAAEGRSRAA